MASMMDYPAWMQYYNTSRPCGYYPAAQDYSNSTCMVSPQPTWPQQGGNGIMYNTTPPAQQMQMPMTMGYYNPSLSPTHRGTPRPIAMYHGLGGSWPKASYLERESCSPVPEPPCQGCCNMSTSAPAYPSMHYNGDGRFAAGHIAMMPHPAEMMNLPQAHAYSCPPKQTSPQWTGKGFKRPVPMMQHVQQPRQQADQNIYYSVHNISVKQDMAIHQMPPNPPVLVLAQQNMWPAATNNLHMSMQTAAQHSYTAPRSDVAVVPSDFHQQHSSFHEVQQYKQKDAREMTRVPDIGSTVNVSSVPTITLDTGSPQVDDWCKTPSRESGDVGVQLWKQNSGGSKSGADSANTSPVNDCRRGMISPELLSDDSAISPQSMSSGGSSYDADEEQIMLSPNEDSSSHQDSENSETQDHSEETRYRHMHRRSNKTLNALAVYLLNDWYQRHMAHPYPANSEKKLLADMGGIAVSQVTAWFANKRNRTGNTKPKREKRKLGEQVVNFCKELAKAAGTNSGMEELVTKSQINMLLDLDETESAQTKRSKVADQNE